MVISGQLPNARIFPQLGFKSRTATNCLSGKLTTPYKSLNRRQSHLFGAYLVKWPRLGKSRSHWWCFFSALKMGLDGATLIVSKSCTPILPSGGTDIGAGLGTIPMTERSFCRQVCSADCLTLKEKKEEWLFPEGRLNLSRQSREKHPTDRLLGKADFPEEMPGE